MYVPVYACVHMYVIHINFVVAIIILLLISAHLVAPTLSRPPQSAIFYTGRIAYLECGISSETFPQPNVTWYRGSDRVDFTGRYFFSPNTKSLIIRNVALTDAALYTCEVSNVAGSERSNATLMVQDRAANGM